MSVIIRLQNLPWTASALDIRSYFEGLSIPEGGVRILGGEIGDAFILFSTDEDARKAMLKDGGQLGGVQIRLYLSSRTEMVKVFEDLRSARTKPTTSKKEDSINFEEYKIQAGVVEEHIPPCRSPTTTAYPVVSQSVKRMAKNLDIPNSQQKSNTLNKYELSLLNDIDHSDQGSAEYSPMTPSISYAEYKKRSRDRSRSPRAHHDSDCRDKYESREHERESNNAYALARKTKTNHDAKLTNNDENNIAKKGNEMKMSEKINDLSNGNWLLAFMQTIKNKNINSTVPKLSNDVDMGKEQKSITSFPDNNTTEQFSILKVGQDNNVRSSVATKIIINNYKNGSSVGKIAEKLCNNNKNNNKDDNNECVKTTTAISTVYKNYTTTKSAVNTINGVQLPIVKQELTNCQEVLKVPQNIFNVPPPTLSSITSHPPYNMVAAFPNKIDTTIPPPTINTYSIPNNTNNNNNFNVLAIPKFSKMLPISQPPETTMMMATTTKATTITTTITPSTTRQNIDNQLKCIEVSLASLARIIDIRNLFNDISIPIDGIKMQYNNNNNNNQGYGNKERSFNSVMCYAFIKFMTAADAQKALLKNHTIYNNKPILINLISEQTFNAIKTPTIRTTTSPTAPKSKLLPIIKNNNSKFYNDNNNKTKEAVKEMNVLCVENLTALTEKEKIKAMFAAYGNYDVIMAEQFGNRSGFWAFLKFKNEIAAKAALADYSAHTLNGQIVKVRVSCAEEAIASKKAELLAHEKLTRDQQALLNGTDSSFTTFTANNNNNNNIVNNNIDSINMKDEDKNDNFIIMKNVIYTTTRNDVHRMLMVAGFPPNQIELLYNDINRPKGEIIVEFNDAITAKSAVKDLNNKPFRGRTMRVHSITPQQVADIMQKPCYNYLPRQNFVDV